MTTIPQSKSKRLKEILRVFMKYRVVQNLSQQQNPQEVRRAFEELGPTFIKIGQMLSVRTDLLNPAYLQTFKSLQDNVPSDDFSEVKQLLEKEWSLPLEDIFTSFDSVPFASASIGQAHKAVLKSGQVVVVKVQHPGIIEAIAVDLALFEKALPLIKFIPESNVVDIKSVLKEVRHSLDSETDFLKESQNAEEFYKKNHHWQQVEVPKVYPEYCTKKVILLEWMPGKSIRYLLEAEANEFAYSNITNRQMKKELGLLLVESFMKQIFEDGFFHADPHPGNLFLHLLTPDEAAHSFVNKKRVGVLGGVDYSLKWQDTSELPPYRLIYLDFGMMGRLNDNLRSRLADTLIAIYTQDSQEVGKAVLRLCKKEGSFSEEKFYQELEEFLENYYDLAIKEIDLQEVLGEVIAICHTNNLQLNQEVTLLIKAFSTLEGLVEELDPSLSLMEVTQPFAQKYFLQRIDLQESTKRSALDLLKAGKALPKLPDRTLSALETLIHGKGQIRLAFKEQEQILRRAERMLLQLVIGIFLSALLIGSSLLLTNTAQQPEWITRLGIGGYIFVFALLFLALLRLLHHYFRK